MDRKIQEDFTLGWKTPGIVFGAVMALVLGSVLVVAITEHDLKTCLMMGGLLVGLPLYFLFMRRWSIKDMAAGAKVWVQTDSGLQCTYGEPPETETIRWSQIQRMRWVRSGGLQIFWEESGRRGPQFHREFHEGDIAGVYRGRLRVGEKEADELAAAWQKHRGSQATGAVAVADLESQPGETVHHPLHPGQADHHRKPVRRKLSRQSQKTLWLGGAMGLFFIGWSCVNMLKEFPSSAWPSTQGKIMYSGFTQLPWDGKHSQKGRVTLTYEYMVDGYTHIAQQYSVRHQDFVEALEEARRFASAHPMGNAIRVYYDPKQPANAVLMAGVDWEDDSAFLILGGFFLSIMLLARWMMLLQARRTPMIGSRRTGSNWLMKEYGGDRN